MATSESGAFSRLPDIMSLIGIMLTGAKRGYNESRNPCPLPSMAASRERSVGKSVAWVRASRATNQLL